MTNKIFQYKRLTQNCRNTDEMFKLGINVIKTKLTLKCGNLMQN